MTTQNEPRIGGTLLNKREAAHYLHISERTVDDWMKRRRLPYIKIGKLVRFRSAELDAAMEKFKVS